MYSVGDTVVYGTQGVCRIKAIEENDISGESIEYYVLQPVFDDNSTVYVPVKNSRLVSQMRSVMSEEEIYDIIREMPDEQTIWINDENERTKEYQALINEGDSKKLVKLIKTLYYHQLEQKKLGRRLHTNDETALKKAESLLYEEFALVLNIKPDEVLPFIEKQIRLNEK